MSDVAETTATDAPQVATPPAQPAGEENLSPRDRARALGRKVDQARSETERKARQAAEQHRDGGRFAQETPADKPADSASESEPPVPQGAAPVADGGPAEGFERVFYPDGHPIREQGVEYDDVPEAAAMRFKAALNGTYYRRQDVEQATAKAQALEERLARMEAETRFRSERGPEFWTADDQAFYEDAKEKYGEEFAEVYRQGKVQKAEAALRENVEGAELAAVAGRVEAAGKVFKADALAGLPQLFPGLTVEEADTAIAMYAHELNQVQERAEKRGMSAVDFFRKFGGYNEQDFYRVASGYLESRPGVIARRQASSQASDVERNRIRAEVEEQKRREMQDASTRHATNPNRNLGGASVGPSVSAESEPESMVGKSVGQIAKYQKAKFLDSVRARLGG